MNNSEINSLMKGGRRPPGAVEPVASFRRRSEIAVHLHGWMRDMLKDISPESSILAVGCEEAFLGPQLLEYAANVTVLDTCGGQIAQLAPRFPEISFFHYQPPKRLPFPTETFDVACCCELLDRVFDPQMALQELHRVLAPGGRLLLTVPDCGAMQKVFRAIFGRQSGDETHPRLHHFTRRALAKRARESGFRDVRIATVEAPARANDAGCVRLLLTARRGPEVRRYSRGDATRTQPAVWPFDEELAFAGRTRAA